MTQEMTKGEGLLRVMDEHPDNGLARKPKRDDMKFEILDGQLKIKNDYLTLTITY